MSDPRASIRLLVVDDEPDLAALTGDMLQREDERFSVETATNAESGRERLHESEFDCIVSDYDMPGQNGIDFLQTVRADDPDLPFILFTGKGSEEVASEAISAGVTDYLQKESGMDQYRLLANRVTDAIEHQRTKTNFREIFEKTPDGIVVHDAEDGSFVDMNAKYAELYGYSQSEFLDVGFEAIHLDEGPYTLEQAEAQIQKAIEEGPQTFEWRAVRKDGTTFWAEVHLAQVELNGKDRVLASVRDVTERKELEAESDAALTKYQTLVEQNLAGIFIIQHGEFEYVNPKFCEITGYSETELRDMHALDVIPADARESVQENVRRQQRGEIETAEYTPPIERKDGERRRCRAILSRVDLHGEPADIGTLIDVTHQAALQDQLEQERELLDRVLETSPVSILILSPDGQIQRANHRAEDVLGVPESEITDRTFDDPSWNLVDDTGDPIPESDLPFQRVMETGEPIYGFEHGLQLEDGRERWLSVNAAPLTAADGEIEHVVAVLVDVTERKADTLDRERRYEAIFNHTYQFTGLLEPDGTVIEANQTALEFGGLDPDDVLGKPFWEADWWQIDDETQRELREAIDRAADGEFVRYEVDVQGESETVTIDFSIRPVTADNGTVEYLIPEGRNLSELKSLQQRERELEQIRERMEYALEFTDSIIWAVDLDTGEVTNYGPIEQLFGGEPGDIATFLTDVIHPEDRHRVERVYEAIRRGETDVFDVEFRLQGDQGEADWIASRGYVQPETDDETPRLIGLATDVSDRKEREQELSRQNERLEKFASVVSHDLRNPLNVAQGHLELAREARDSEHLAAVSQAHDRMASLVDDVLSLAKEGDDALDPEPVALDEAVHHCWQHVATADASLEVDTDRRIIADANRLQHLLENVLRNAVEHGGRDVTVTIGTLQEGFFVEDDGPGIPEGDREQIFEPGYSTSDDGTGLGLSIVRDIADAHGWEVSVTDRSGGGTRFEFSGVTTAAEP